MPNDTRAYTITFTEKGLEQEPELDNRKQWANKLTPSSCQTVVELQDGTLHIIDKIRQSTDTKVGLDQSFRSFGILFPDSISNTFPY